MATLINVVVGDKNYDLNFVLTDAQGNAVDLTNATLAFKAQLLSDLSISSSEAMTITDATTGACKFTVQPGDFSIAGEYNCQIVVTFSGPGEQITFPDITVVAEAAVPIA